MYYRYSTALSHLFLVIISAYCLKNYNPNNGQYYPILTYLIVFTNSLSGIWKWGNPENGYTSNAIYYHSRLLQTLFAFPFIVLELWMKNELIASYLSYVHILILCSFILWLLYYCKKYEEKFVDIVIALNIFLCFVTSLSSENWYGISLGLSYSINHFVLREGCEIFDMPTIDFYNYAFCFFMLFSLKALQVA